MPTWVHELVRRGVAERKTRQLALDVPDTQPVADQIEYVDFLMQTECRRKLREEEALGEHEAELRRLKLRADYDEFCRLEVKRKMESLYPPARLEEALRKKIKRIRREQPEWYGRMPDPMKRETAIGMLEAEVRERAHLPGFEQWSKQDPQMRMF